MYIGSVKFYKHIILLLLTVIVLASLSAAVHYRNQNKILKQEIEKYENGFSVLKQSSKFPFFSPSFEYQTLYPNLFVKNDFSFDADKANSVYLTFDDGPSAVTEEILDILSQRNIKATFFVIAKDGEENDRIYRRIVSEGHTIALHSTTHDYNSIYNSVDAFLNDINLVNDRVFDATGYKPELYRFPGGSVNPHNAKIYRQATAELLRRGFTYYDWNVSADDAVSGTSKTQMAANIISGVHSHNKSIVLLHDAASKKSTVEILPEILDTLISEGYEFYPLTKKVMPVVFDYEKAKFTIKE